MPLPVVDRRADQYRKHARELVAAAWREDDINRKRYLFDLSKQYQRAADAIAPQPPTEQIFNK